MSTRLVILGLLKSKPLYGYELKQVIEEHMGDWTSIAFGSIYFALNKLNEEGFVERVSEEKSGNRPSRSIFQITERGNGEFTRILKEIWLNNDRQYYPLDIALAFSDSLPANEIKGYIKKRIDYLDSALNYVEVHKREQLTQQDIPKTVKIIFAHTEYHSKAERDWLISVLESFDSGELS